MLSFKISVDYFQMSEWQWALTNKKKMKQPKADNAFGTKQTIALIAYQV